MLSPEKKDRTSCPKHHFRWACHETFCPEVKGDFPSIEGCAMAQPGPWPFWGHTRVSDTWAMQVSGCQQAPM